MDIFLKKTIFLERLVINQSKLVGVLILALILLVGCGNERASTANEASKGRVISSEMPFTIAFRGERIRKLLKNYSNWEHYYQKYSGSIRKYTSEELLNLPKSNQVFAAKFDKNYPNKLKLLHFDGRARQVHTAPLVYQRYFPGHWVYLPGSRVLLDVTENVEQIKVENSRVFSLKAYTRKWKKKTINFPHDALLVAVDESGNRLWYQSEYVQIKSLNHHNNLVEIKRGQYFSKPRSFKAHRAFLLPLAAGIWGGKPMWFYNYSTQSPVDKNGKHAGDIVAEELQQWLGTELKWLDGIAFDVVDWRVNSKWDTDNNNYSDGGYIKGVNEFARGNLHFLEKLRKLLPENKILTADGYRLNNQRAIHVLNGIEFEGTVRYDDAFRAFSNTVNILNFWKQQQYYRPQFSYLVQKFRDQHDKKNQQRLTRFGVALASIYGVGSGFIGIHKINPLYESGWLGKPISSIKRLALSYPLNDFIQTPKVISNAKISHQGKELIISPLDVLEPMRLSWSLPKPKEGDLLLQLTLLSLKNSIDFPKKAQIPRAIKVTATNLPYFGEGIKKQKQYTKSYGLFNADESQQLSFYFRRAAKARGKTLNLVLNIEPSNSVKMSQIALYQSADIHWREFEKGYLLLNPSLEPQRVDLTHLLGNNKWTLFNRLTREEINQNYIIIPPIDALYPEKGI